MAARISLQQFDNGCTFFHGFGGMALALDPPPPLTLISFLVHFQLLNDTLLWVSLDVIRECGHPHL